MDIVSEIRAWKADRANELTGSRIVSQRVDFRASVVVNPERFNPAPTRLPYLLSCPRPSPLDLVLEAPSPCIQNRHLIEEIREHWPNVATNSAKTITASALSRIQFRHRSSAAPFTMAIHPSFPSQADVRGPLSPQQAQAISTWTEQAAASLGGLRITDSAPRNEGTAALRGASVSLSIPLDDPVPATDASPNPRVRVVGQIPEEPRKVPAVTFRRREPLRRDSLKRREALLKGKDGSRRRQRWENGMS